MAANGHAWIDVLKINIEGAEFASLTRFIDDFAGSSSDGGGGAAPVLPVGQIQLEIHAWGGYKVFATSKKWWERLEWAGLRPFRSEPNLVYMNLMHLRQPDLVEVRVVHQS